MIDRISSNIHSGCGWLEPVKSMLPRFAGDLTFTRLVDRVLTVPKEEILRREADYKKRAEANPRKRGPQRKTIKPSASPVPAS